MKLVREHINEKFEKDSDPIKDLDIGASSKHVWANLEKGDILRIKRDIPVLDKKKGAFIEVLNKIGPYKEEDKKYVEINYKYYRNKDKLIAREDSATSRIWKFRYEWFKDNFELVDISSLNEKFEETSDPIKDMGIGVRDFFKKEVEKIGHHFYIDSMQFFNLYDKKYKNLKKEEKILLNLYVSEILKDFSKGLSFKESFDKSYNYYRYLFSAIRIATEYQELRSYCKQVLIDKYGDIIEKINVKGNE